MNSHFLKDFHEVSMLSSHLTSATEARKMAVSPLRRSQRGSVAASLSKSPSHAARMDSRSPYIFPLKMITFMVYGYFW